MEKNENQPFIFYITYEEELPKTFFAFDKALKQQGFILVPVRVDQLQKMISFAEQNHAIVLCSITDTREMKLYNEKVRSLLKFILKNKRLTFIHLSSFSKLNDSRLYSMNKNYYFMKYPLNAVTLSKMIARYFELKSEANVRWPGGKRAGLGAIA